MMGDKKSMMQLLYRMIHDEETGNIYEKLKGEFEEEEGINYHEEEEEEEEEED